MEDQNLPPVPDNLRALARRQLDNPATSPYESMPRMLSHLARLHRNMQEIMLERTKVRHALTHAPNQRNGEWSRRLAEFDQSRQALRNAYDAYRAAKPVAEQVRATWHAAHGIHSNHLFSYEKDDDAIVLYLQPKLALVCAEADGLWQIALRAWIKATVNYFQLLNALHSPMLLAA